MEEKEDAGDGAPAGKKIVQWERILPRRSLRVLLVECDDSTRHILAALLKKCGYLVVAAADGVKAWEVMKEKNHNFDLVLAEVDMPLQSGIRLLTKIMATDKCRSIPVIMMSSHDSMGLVHKCMLKGASDYLLKPVRKNELSNMWQHVWRRHCSESYAGPLDNSAASNCLSANIGDHAKTGLKSNEESDAQSSGCKPDNETESHLKPIEPHLAKQGRSSKDTKGQEKQPVNGTTVTINGFETDDSSKKQGKSVTIGVETVVPVQNSSIAEIEHEKSRIDSVSTNKNGLEGSLYVITKDGGNNCSLHQQNNEPLHGKLHFVKPVSDKQSSFAAKVQNAPFDVAKDSSYAKNGLNDPEPEMELSVGRPLTNGCISQQVKEKRTLIHSNGSAFSRYGDRKFSFASQTVITSELCTKQKESRDKYQSQHIYDGDETHASFARREIPQMNVGKAILCPRSDNNEENGGQSYYPGRQDGGQSNGNTIHYQQPQVGLISVPNPIRMMSYQGLCANHGAIFQPMYKPEPFLTPHGADSALTPKSQTPNGQSGCQDIQQNASADSFRIHPDESDSHPSHFRHRHAAEGPANSLQGSSFEPTNQTGSSNKGFVNGVGSIGSGETTDSAGDTGAALETGNESGVQNCNKGPMDSDRTHREAALVKFRLKRKERCFEKRVRYHSRKKLAEQRPRVKGQFVRQKTVDMKLTNESTL